MSDDITAKEIKRIRKGYGLSQKAFALLLGIGPASIVRYEQGSQPSKANANLIRAARNPEFMRECIERDGGLLSDAQRKTTSEIVYALVSLDGAEGAAPALQPKRGKGPAMNMNEMYELTLRQEVLNEKAANIMGEIISVKIGGGFPGSANDVYDSLLDQVSQVKYTIIDTRDMAGLDEVSGFLNCAQRMIDRSMLEVA